MARNECTWRTRLNRGFLAAFLVLFVTIWSGPGFTQTAPGGGQQGSGEAEFPLTVVQRPFEQEIPVPLQFRQFFLGDLLAFDDGTSVFVPLKLVTDALQFAIEVDLIQGRAQGFFINENNTFFLDLRSRMVLVNGVASAASANQAELQFDDIFVDSRLFGQWFGVDLVFDRLSQVLLVEPQEGVVLPLEARLELEALRNQGGGSELRERFDLQPVPYRLIAPPSLDFSSSFSHTNGANQELAGNVQNSASYSAQLTGDLLFMNGQLSIQGGEGDLLSDARFKLERKDNDRRLFSGVEYVGPLRLSEFAIGDVFTPQVPFIAGQREGQGIAISSFPLNSPTDFDLQTFRGELPFGWEVELFRNDTFLDFRTSDPAGRYEFIDVSLGFGQNDFRFEFFGPQGQRRTETISVPVGPGALKPGEEFFRAGLVQENTRVLPFIQDGDDRRMRYSINYERGITREISLVMNGSSLSLGDDGRHSYFGAGIRTSLGNLTVLPDTFLRLDWVKDLNSGMGGIIGLQSTVRGIDITAQHESYHSFDSEATGGISTTSRVEKRTSLRGDGVLPLFGSLPDIGFIISANETRIESGLINTSYNLRLSSTVKDIGLTNQVGWALQRGVVTNPETRIDGEFTARTNLDNGRFIAATPLTDVRVRATLDYDIQPEKQLTGFAVSTEGLLPHGVAARLDITRNLGSSTSTNIAPSLSKNFERFSLGLSGNFANSGDFSLGASLSLGAFREPRSGRIITEPVSVGGRGVVSIRAFIDVNGNGVYDAGEVPLPGIKFRDAEFEDVETDERGLALASNLTAFSRNVVEIDRRSIGDPFIQPKTFGVEILPRPGVVVEIDFPFQMIGEVDGFILLREGGVLRPVADLALQLRNEAGDVVKEIRSTFDGFYLFTDVFPGKYTVEIPLEALRGQSFGPPTPLSIEITGEGEILSGVDIVLN